MVTQQDEQYRGKRALEFLRVSTPEQMKSFGWPRQHAAIQEKLIDPLDLRVVDTIKDSYTGLDFQIHAALDEALIKAKKREYDLLLVDMLDRLGRKGLEREIYMLELKQAGVRVLSTNPEDHSDDESSWGELIRYLKGRASEDELNNIKYRTMGGRRSKATGDPERGITPKIVGNGNRLYGYKFILDERGKRVGLEPNHDIVHTENDGTEWTEVKIIIFTYESLANGTPARATVKILNEKGIPTPYISKSIKSRKIKETTGWNPIAVSRIVKHPAYSLGEHHQFKTIALAKAPGKRFAQRVKAPDDHHVIISVPTIVTRELAETAQNKLAQNKQVSKRNNRNPQASLLRAGLAKCGYCGCALRVYSKIEKNRKVEREYASYNCNKPYNSVGQCPGCSIPVHTLDDAAWSKAIEIINNPTIIDEWVKTLKSDDPTKDRRKVIDTKLKEIREQQQAMRENLGELMKMKRPDIGTIQYLNGQLQQLADQEEQTEAQLSRDTDTHLIWKAVQNKVDELHRQCAEMREKMCDSNYQIPYEKKRELLEFLGVEVIAWKKDHKPRFTIQCKPSEIVKLLS